MKRYSRLQFLFGLFVVLSMILLRPFDIYAITPLTDMVSDTSFSDGPWSGHRFMTSAIDSSGSVSSTEFAAPSWREGSDLGDAYYQISLGSYTYKDCYWFSSGQYNNMTIVSYDPLTELYAIDGSGNIVADVLQSAFITEYSDKYFYGVSCSNGTGVAFRCGNITYITELSTAFNGGGYYDAIASALPYLGGVYDGNSIAVRYPGLYNTNAVAPMMVSYGFDYLYYPVVCVPGLGPDYVTCWNFISSDGVLHSDSEYTFNFLVYNITNGRIYIGDINSFNGATVSLPNFTVCIEGQETALGNLGFGFRRSTADSPVAICFAYQSSSSDDIGTLPPDDSGGDSGGSGSPDYSSALSQIGARLEDVMASVSDGAQSVVNNITYQTTQITNTITNTVTNMTQQITQGLSDVKQGITDKLQGVQEGISSSIEDANKEQMENDQKLHDEQIAADKENTDTIVNGFDSGSLDDNGSKLEDSLTEYEEAEKNVIDKVNDSLNDFEFDSGFEEYTNTISTISDFLQALYDSSGGFKVVINLSLMLSLASLVIGFYRFKG